MPSVAVEAMIVRMAGMDVIVIVAMVMALVVAMPEHHPHSTRKQAGAPVQHAY